jgi:hypothetical protein
LKSIHFMIQVESRHRRRCISSGDRTNVNLVERFQNLADRPYQARYTAAAFHCTSNYQDSAVTGVDITKRPEKQHLALLLVKGSTTMELVNQLYEVAADEALRCYRQGVHRGRSEDVITRTSRDGQSQSASTFMTCSIVSEHQLPNWR